MSARLPDRRQVRRAIPRPLRYFLYDHSLSRARRWKRAPGVERVGANAVALTFDDGPDREGTPAVLEELERLRVKASFFVLGSQVDEDPELARELRERGHDVCLHGMTHHRHDRLSLAEAKTELSAGAAAIERAIGERPRWYRPPYGRSSTALAAACRELDLELVYWTSWGFDWEPVPAARIERTVRRDLGPGAIVLLHDSARYAERDDPAATAAAVPGIVAAAHLAGLDVLPLGMALGADG